MANLIEGLNVIYKTFETKTKLARAALVNFETEIETNDTTKIHSKLVLILHINIPRNIIQVIASLLW